MARSRSGIAAAAALAAGIACAGARPPAPAPPQEIPPHPAQPRQPAPPEPGYVIRYGQVLDQIVAPDGLVRYERIAKGNGRYQLGKVRAGYWKLPLPEPGPQRLAFLLNAYNVNVLSLVLEHGSDLGGTLRSVNEVPGFFDELSLEVGQVRTTLDGLRNDMIRPLGDPRVHAALVHGAMCSPPLRREPYDARCLSAQLDDQCRRWVNDPARNRVEGEALALSEIFRINADDFAVEPFGGVIGFVKAYAEPGGPIAGLLAKHPDPPVTWLACDRALNRAAPAP